MLAENLCGAGSVRLLVYEREDDRLQVLISGLGVGAKTIMLIHDAHAAILTEHFMFAKDVKKIA